MLLMHSKPTASPLRVHVVNSVLVNNRCSRNRVKHTNTVRVHTKSRRYKNS